MERLVYNHLPAFFFDEKAVSSIFNNKYQVKHQIKLCYSVLGHQY